MIYLMAPFDPDIIVRCTEARWAFCKTPGRNQEVLRMLRGNI